MRTMQRRMAHEVLGRRTESNNAIDAMRDAGLDWVVGLEELKTASGLPVENKFATVRTKYTLNSDGVVRDDKVLGVVGRRYHVLQNAEIFEALDTLVDAGSAYYSMAGELDGGSIVWTVMDLPRGVHIDNDPHAAQLLARTSHDGSSSLQISPIVSRLACTNQINSFLARGSHQYRLRHTSKSRINIQEMRDMLGVVYAEIEEYERVASAMQNAETTEAKARELLKQIFPMPRELELGRYIDLTSSELRKRTSTLTKRQSVLNIFNGSTGTQDDWIGTGYGLYQAVIEYADHFTSGSPKKRAERTFTRKNDPLKKHAMNVVMLNA